MSVYKNFIGIDIGKFTFVVSKYDSKEKLEYKNTEEGIALFLKEKNEVLIDSLSVVEVTGGYELELVNALCEGGYKVHRGDPRKIKNFIRSWGTTAKTGSFAK